MIELPEVNTLVQVEVAEGLILPSRVESVDGLDLVLAAPRYVGNVEPPKTGDFLAVRWTGRRGLSALPARFATTRRTNVAAWVVQVVGDIEVVQRRRYVRAPVGAPVTLTHPEYDSIRIGHMLDLSEGGLRVRLTRNPADLDEEVVVRLAVEDQVIDVPGTILRAESIGGGFEEVVVRFEDDHRQANAIRRFVFREQARMRRAGLV